jgi:dihydroorotate dehydrogenase electron transfer subunit
MVSTVVKINSNQKLSEEFYLLGFSAPNIAAEANPGQFLQIRVSQEHSPLLRRPFSIFDVQEAFVYILYKVVGKGTELLSRKKCGDEFGVVGPLGNSFKIPPPTNSAFLIGGGIGIAPLKFLAEELTRQNVNSLIFYGARNVDQLVGVNLFDDLKIELATDDGSGKFCFAGCVTDLFQSYIQNLDVENSVVYACGPFPMMEVVSMLAKERSIPCQLSLEERMACGFGACLGCVVETVNGYKRVCVEGPVFDQDELVF